MYWVLRKKKNFSALSAKELIGIYQYTYKQPVKMFKKINTFFF